MSPLFETMYSNSGWDYSNVKAVGASGDYGGSSGGYYISFAKSLFIDYRAMLNL